MTVIRRATLALLLFSAIAAAPVDARKSHHQKERDTAATQSTDFDYYLMSMSWSPSFCASHPQDHDQCGGQGYGFVLHGLWPQYASGSTGPQHCATSQKPDEATVREMLSVTPSRTLIAHEWQTHGACSGLDPAGYFAAGRKAFDAIRVPAVLAAATTPPKLSARDIGDAFVAANPGLRRDMLAVKCDGIALSEVRVCLSKDLQPRQCGAQVATSCHQGALEIPLAKGRR